ncbi:YcbK family protein [Persicirhabdus sediminis]|uniref:DUF882 domain-containing protein n=1 Tax=Persicirhabdus sediminis TaxID=454144 RepID=A0A8J7SHN1_9BACT|nr:D-Ala-D-Ala carboxypeptidase family metallohydrolase [Persicirhabdus sediminis]MBK1789959.1 DUF882 domain-containing protein [Persicirhabdus sediminis]
MDQQADIEFAKEDALSVLGRRGFMTLFGASMAGLLMSGNEVEAGLFGSRAPVPGIPDEWTRLKGRDVMSYARYIQGMKLRNVTPYMVIAPHFKKRGSVTNDLPPKSQWRKMKPTLLLVDHMAGNMGAPIKEIVSAYRSPRYNRAVRGKSRSFHMQNVAVDVTFHGASPWRAAAMAKKLRDQGKYKGGVGRYSSFVHVDTRGQNADW